MIALSTFKSALGFRSSVVGQQCQTKPMITLIALITFQI